LKSRLANDLIKQRGNRFIYPIPISPLAQWLHRLDIFPTIGMEFPEAK